MDDDLQARATSFGRVADDYERYRPGPPPEAVAWALPEPVDTARVALAGSADVLEGTVSGRFTPPATVLEVADGLPFAPPAHERFAWDLPLSADDLVGMLATMSWVIVLPDDERVRVLAEARRLLGDVFGITGEVTVGVGYVCDTYRTTRAAG